MPKPKTRPAIASTKYGNITPTWVPEGQQFPAQYNEATEALANWAGPDWADESKSSFAKIRRAAVELCERWNAWDWDADELDLKSKKQDLKNYSQVIPALEIVEHCLMQSHDDRLAIFLSQSMATALQLDINRSRYYWKHAAIQGFGNFRNYAIKEPLFAYWYGPMRYRSLPAKMADRRIVLSLVLADMIGCIDTRVTGQHYPSHRRPPVLQSGLPWKAIGLFASANQDDPEALFNVESVQQRASALANGILEIWPYRPFP